MSDSKQLRLALQADYDRSNQPNVTDKLIAEIYSSMVYQYDWPQLVGLAPIAISSTGLCCLASASGAAGRITLTPPEGGFKYLMYTRLNASLVECGNLGRMSFLTAEGNLNAIQSSSNTLRNKVGDIVETLMDPPTAKKLLKVQMSGLKRSVDDSYEKAKQIDDAFAKWLMNAGELYSSCVAVSSGDDEKLQASLVNMSIAEATIDPQVDSVAESRRMADMVSKNADQVFDAYKQASDAFQSGWEIMDQEILAASMLSLSTALSQAFAAYTNTLSPLRKAGASSTLFGAGAAGGANGSAPEPPMLKQPLPPKAEDPAYAQVRRIMPYLSSLHVILTKGKDSNIESKSAEFISTTLRQAQQAFDSLATGDEPSRQLKDILATAGQVAEGVKNEIAKSSYPANDSDLARGWQSQFKAAYSSAQKMQSFANSLPGTASGFLPIMSNAGEDPSSVVAKSNANSLPALTKVEATQNRLASNQNAFLSTREIYQSAIGTGDDLQKKLSDTADRLASLSQSKMEIGDIKTALKTMISLIIPMKVQIVNLTKTFQAISSTIDTIINVAVMPFLKEVEAESFKLGNYTLTDLLRTFVYSGAVQIRAYTGVAADIAKMWVALSQQNIMPGVKMVDDMSMNSGNESMTNMLKQRTNQLQGWTAQAQRNMSDLAKKQQEQRLGDMSEQFDGMMNITKQIPSTPEVTQAIEAGRTTVVDAAKDAMTTNTANKPFIKWWA